MTADDRLAAELAIGLLDGQELLSARGRASSDPAFAALVEAWEARLAPLLDTIAPSEPPEEIWARIAAELDQGNTAGDVVDLRRRLLFWRGAASLSALAACAALALVVLQPQMRGAPQLTAAPLVASIPIGDTPLRLGVTYLPERRELLVSASGLSADGVHDHELWLVDDAGATHSLGVVVPGRERRVRIDPELARQIHSGSPMVLTREPLGGKPADAAAGPVVAEGAFLKV